MKRIFLFIFTMLAAVGEVKSSTVVNPFHVEDRINKIQALATDRMIMQESGFLEVFANNDASTPVYYDNLTVMHTPGRVLEINTYYPYGMLIPELSAKAALKDEQNWYKFSAKELETALNLNMYDFGARMYDPAIGRWWVPDPLAEKYYSLSPYAYAGNNPVSNIDPTGMAWYSYLEKYVDEDKKEKMRNLIVYNGNINSQEDLDAAGIEGTYLGGRGTGIDEATGKLLYYGADGTAAPAAIQMPEVTVTAEMSDHARVMSSASYLGIYQMQADFWDHPVTRATTTVLTSMIGGGILSNYMHAYSAVNGYRYANVATNGGRQGFKSVGAAAKGFSKGNVFIKGIGNVGRESFHSSIKPNILKAAGNFGKVVGTNPDIMVINGKIVLQGAKHSSFAGKVYKTVLNANDFF